MSVSEKIQAKVAESIGLMQVENQRAVDAVRRAYRDGRWATATPQQRAQTRRQFRIRQVQIRRLTGWLETHGGPA